jgi:hypothetical protein
MKIIRKYISQICTITFIMMMLAFMVFMTRVNIRHDQTPAIDDNARLETLTGIVSSSFCTFSFSSSRRSSGVWHILVLFSHNPPSAILENIS